MEGIEVECSVLGNRRPIASIPGEIVANADWYDFAAKYDAGGMELIVPARLPTETAIPEGQPRPVADGAAFYVGAWTRIIITRLS